MRHIRLVARAKRVPSPAQTTGGTTIFDATTPLGIKIEFIAELTDRAITIIMQKGSTL